MYISYVEITRYFLLMTGCFSADIGEESEDDSAVGETSTVPSSSFSCLLIS